MTDATGKLVLVGGLLVGGFFIGKAGFEHVVWSKAQEEYGEFEEQHYRAAGFRKASDKPAKRSRSSFDDVTSFLFTMGGIASALYGIPTVAAEVDKWVKQVAP